MEAKITHKGAATGVPVIIAEKVVHSLVLQWLQGEARVVSSSKRPTLLSTKQHTNRVEACWLPEEHDCMAKLKMAPVISPLVPVF